MIDDRDDLHKCWPDLWRFAVLARLCTLKPGSDGEMAVLVKQVSVI